MDMNFLEWLNEQADKKALKVVQKAKDCSPQSLKGLVSAMGCYVEPQTNHDIVKRSADGKKIETIGRHKPVPFCDKVIKNVVKYCPTKDSPATPW